MAGQRDADGRNPRARTDGLVVRTLDGETLVYDLDRHDAHCLSETAALVWHACDGTRQVPELAALLPGSLGTDAAEALVLVVLDELEGLALIETRPTDPPRLSREALLRRVGLAAAVATPLVASLAVPEPAAALSCGATGAPCTVNADCCSNICAGVVCV